MATGGATVGGSPCGPEEKFISSPETGAPMVLLRLEVGSLLTAFAKGALVMVVSVADWGIDSSLLTLIGALRV